MAGIPCNVFGDPINNKNQTPIQNAQQALNEIETDGKYEQALLFVRNLKSQSGNGVSGLLYNATGSTITFSSNKNWFGTTTSAYSQQIQNGQFGSFVHSPVDGNGSMAAVVYRGKDATGSNCDYMGSWDNKSNTVCTEINVPNYFEGEWDRIYEKLKASAKQVDKYFWNGCQAQITIFLDAEAIEWVFAAFTLDDPTARGVTSTIPRLYPGVVAPAVGYDVDAADCDGDAAARATSEAAGDAAAT